MEPLDSPSHQTLGPLIVDCWRNIAITLIDRLKGEQTAHTCANA